MLLKSTAKYINLRMLTYQMVRIIKFPIFKRLVRRTGNSLWVWFPVKYKTRILEKFKSQVFEPIPIPEKELKALYEKFLNELRKLYVVLQRDLSLLKSEFMKEFRCEAACSSIRVSI